MLKRFLVVGPAPPAGGGTQGGQLTAALGMYDYARRAAFEVQVIDTLQPVHPPPPLHDRLRRGARRVWQVLRSLRGQRFDGAIFFVGARISFHERTLQALLCKRCGVPTAFMIRDGFFPGWMAETALRRRLVSSMLGLPDRVFVQGENIRRRLAELGAPAHRIGVLRNWLPPGTEVLDASKEPPKDRALRLLFVGVLVREKGVAELCDAVDRLAERYSLELDLVGGGTMEAQLRTRYENASTATVHLRGWQPAPVVRALLDAADVFVLPSHAEGFPNALLEAAARGLPAISCDVGAITDLVVHGENGLIVPVDDAASLACAIERYLVDPALVAAHSRRMLERVRDHHDGDANLRQFFAQFERP